MSSLFQSLARNRPEWLAQGLFIRAVESEPAIRALLWKRFGEKGTAPAIRSVTEECPTDLGWRADVVIEWKGGLKKHVELKLHADLTVHQREAIRKEKIDALVVMSAEQAQEFADLVPVITWRALAEVTEIDPTLKSLLGEVAIHRAWALNTLTQAELGEEFQGFISKSTSAQWGRMYRFLSTVHLHLRAAPRYEASNGWTVMRRGASPYYGFCFYLDGKELPRFWLGVYVVDGSPTVGLTVPSAKPKELVLPLTSAQSAAALDAAELARTVLKAATDHAADTRGA